MNPPGSETCSSMQQIPESFKTLRVVKAALVPEQKSGNNNRPR